MRNGMNMSRGRFSRWLRRSMPCLLAVLGFSAYSGRAAEEPEKAQQRDGVWLRNGISHYERLNAREGLSDNDASDALIVRSYVCAIVDLEEYLVLRADLLAGAVSDARKRRHINPQKLSGMAEVLPIIVPLMQTKFSTDSPPCDRVVLVVRDYLGKYPEMLTKDADVVIERALLNAYSNINDP